MKSLLELSEEHREKLNEISEMDITTIEGFLENENECKYIFKNHVQIHDLETNLNFDAHAVCITQEGKLVVMIDEFYCIDIIHLDYLSINRLLMQIGIETNY